MNEYPNEVAQLRIDVSSVGRSVRIAEVVADPVVAALIVEDACWRIAWESWLARKPRRWQRRRLTRWLAEREQLCDLQEQVRSLARHCGLAEV